MIIGYEKKGKHKDIDFTLLPGKKRSLLDVVDLKYAYANEEDF